VEVAGGILDDAVGVEEEARGGPALDAVHFVKEAFG
jgi:hypothetical protein